ncbi:MAG: rod shape-determining protein MreC [Bacillota bacterium]|nr:rod shape-determining protein MreC [Bacillota bacterium]
MKFFRNKLAVAVAILSVTFLIAIAYTAKRDNKNFLEGGVGTVFNKVQGAFYSANSKIDDFFSFIVHFSEVKNENEELRKENAELQNQVLNYNSLKSENENLREQAKFEQANAYYDFVGCNIVSVPGASMLDTFILDRGKKDGVIKGRIVLTAQGLIGQVSTVSDTWCTVESISSENIGVGALDLTTNDQGIIRGYKDSNGNPMAKMTYLPLESNIKEGDVIVTSGDGQKYPKGIRIGTVVSVEDDKARVMKNAVIKPFVDLNRLDQVLIILPKDRSARDYIGEEIKQ